MKTDEIYGQCQQCGNAFGMCRCRNDFDLSSNVASFKSRDRRVLNSDGISDLVIKKIFENERRKREFLEAGVFPETEEQIAWMEEYLEARPEEEKKRSRKALKKMDTEMAVAWLLFAGYLKDAYRDGIKELRVTFKDEKHLIVQPMGKDGESKHLFL